MKEKTSLGRYFSEVDGDKLLTKAQELALAETMDLGRWHDEDGSVNSNKLWDPIKEKEDPEMVNRAKMAREKLVKSNLRLVASVAKHYQNKGCELEDLIQEGNIGLMDGIDRFDHKRGLKISTYCTWWIRQRIDRLISNHGRTVRVPVHVQTLANKLKSLLEKHIKEHNAMPTVLEISEMLECTTDMAKQALQSITNNNTITLDHSPGSSDESDESLHSYIEDKDAASPMDLVSQQELIETIKDVIKTLPPREEKILRLRFGITEDASDHKSWPITFEEIESIQERAKKRAV